MAGSTNAQWPERRVTLPETLGELFAFQAEHNPGAPFAVDSQGTLTYAEFCTRMERIAGGLAKLGISRGDAVAIYLENGLPFLLSAFATAWAGGIFVPIHAACGTHELQYLLPHSDARIVITDCQRLKTIASVRAKCPMLEHVVVVDGEADNASLRFEALLAGTPLPCSRSIRGSDLAAILYTSGTTGFPKGAMLTHRGLILSGMAIRDHLGIAPSDTLYCTLPLAHINGLRTSILAGATAGARVVIDRKFTATGFWDRMVAHRITLFSVLPTIMWILLARPRQRAERDHQVRVCISPATPRLIEEFETRFGVLVVSTYGLTEGVMNFMNFPNRLRRKVEAVGRAIAQGQEVRILDEAGRDLAAGRVGEITIRTPAMFRGYYKDPQATAEALDGGWLHTGDVGWVDRDGFLYFMGRRKEIIRRGGENIAPAEIESVLLQHPKIRDVVVLGVADATYEEEIKACVVLAAGESPDTVPAHELFKFCADRLASFKVPRYLEYRDEIPRTPTLRAQRHLLKMWAQPGEGIVWDRKAKKGEGQ